MRIAWGFAPLLTTVVAACAMPARRPLEAADIARVVEDRGRSDAAVVRDAWALMDAAPLGLSLPEDDLTLADPSTDAFWHGRTLAFAPEVRAARRAWRAARTEAEAAGLPAAINGMGMGVTDGIDATGQAQAWLDVLTLLGLGRRSVDAELAALTTDASFAALESAAWRAVHATDRARVRWSLARLRVEALRRHLAETARGLRRIRTLAERGRIPRGVDGRAKAVVSRLRTDVTAREQAAVRAREDLARAAGLPLSAIPEGPPQTATLDALLDGLSARGLEPESRPTPTDLLFGVPSLRAAMTDYAVAEARLRRTAAQAWPVLGVGPSFSIRPDTLLTGGLLMVDIPWPGSIEPRVRADEERREAARETVEDLLVTTTVAAESRAEELRLTLEQRSRDVAIQEAGSEVAWRSMNARLMVSEGLDVIETWLDALELRARGVVARADADERVMLAALRFQEAAGLRRALP